MNTTATWDSWSVTRADAVGELGRFFQLTPYPAARDEAGAMPMFSPFVDAVWHQMLSENPKVYEEFCREHAGAVIGHAPWSGEGRVGWIGAYERRYGQLPKVWFADATGMVAQQAWASYMLTGTVITDWECRPVRPDDDDPDEFHSPGPPKSAQALRCQPGDARQR